MKVEKNKWRNNIHSLLLYSGSFIEKDEDMARAFIHDWGSIMAS